jgi:hypothetical protein
MESALLVDNINVIGLKLHDPSCIQCRGIFHLHQGLEGSVISDHLEGSSFKEVAKVFHSPYNSQLLQLCSTIISDCSGIGSTCIADDTFSVDLFSFLVILSSNREIL